MKFFCDTCGQKLEAPREFAGQPVDCPSCHTRILVPDCESAISEAEIEKTIRESLVTSPDTFSGSMTIAQLMEQRHMDGGLQVNADVLIGDQNLKYEFGNLIARGGVGAVFSASDQNIRRNVAVKVLLEPENASNEDILRFIEEAQVTGQLEHPSVVPVHDLGVDGAGNVYYTMKMVKGENLHTILSRIAENDPKAIEEFPLTRLLTVFLKICDAMRFAHSKNVIHRDLKPQNIMIGEFGEVVVMDWGLAKVLGQSRDDPHATAEQIDSVRNQDASGALATIAGTIFGTPQFMAPEQARGATAEMDMRTDIYSLGAILYNILALRPPVHGKTVNEILTKVTSGEIVAPTIFNTPKSSGQVQKVDFQRDKKILLKHCPGEKVPFALAAVVMKAMALEREDRYGTVSELQEDIEAYLGGFATSAESAGTLKQAQLFIQRNKLATFSALVISILGIGFVTKTVTAAREIQEVSRTAAPEFVAKARLALKEQKLDEAKAAVETALGLNRKSPEAWFEHARIAFDEYQFVKALSSLEKVNSYTDDRDTLEESQAMERIIREWKARVDDDGEGVLPEHLIEMARQLRDSDPTLAARFFFRVGSEQQALRIQVEDVFAQLIDANPGLKWKSGKGNWPMGIYQFYWIQLFQDTGIELNLSRYCHDPEKLINISPLSNLPVKSLNLEGTNVSDLTPLAEIETLQKLNLDSTPILSLSALKDLNLEQLNIAGTRIDDLSILAGGSIRTLDVSDTRVSDFTPLESWQLESFTCRNFAGQDIEFLRGMPLKRVILNGTKVRSIEPLSKAPIVELDLSESREITELSALKSMPLKILSLGTHGVPDTTVIEGKQFDQLTISFDVPNFQFLKKCRARSVTISGNRSATSLNGFDALRDSLEELNFRGTGKESQLTDIRALRGMKKLRLLRLLNVPVRDLSPLRELKIEKLELILPNAQNVESLYGCQVRELTLGGGIVDLRGLRGMNSLQALNLSGCPKVSQIKVISSLPALERLQLPQSVKDIEFMRGRRKLQQLNYGNQSIPAEQFWRSYDSRRKKGRR